jgi:hypothetical protein
MSKGITRRTVAGGFGVLGAAAIGTRFCVRGRQGAERHGGLTAPRFQQPLKTPRVLKPTTRGETQDEYDIVQREAELEIVPGRLTKIWGYDGCFSGPKIRVRRNRPVVMRHANRLSVHTVVHLHGQRNSGRTGRIRHGHGDAGTIAPTPIRTGSGRARSGTTIMPWIERGRMFIAGWRASTSSRTTKSRALRFRVRRSTRPSFSRTAPSMPTGPWLATPTGTGALRAV